MSKHMPCFGHFGDPPEVKHLVDGRPILANPPHCPMCDDRTGCRTATAIVAERDALRAEVERLQKVEAAVTSVIDGALASILNHCGKTEEQIITKGLYWLLCSHCRPVWDMVCDLREAMEPEKEARHE